MENNLYISEKFYSLQGEGQTVGIPSVFIRLSGCNLLCKSDKWVCDSIEVWKKGTKTAFEDVLSADYVRRLKEGAHLIITGGEPLMHQISIANYLEWFYVTYGFKPMIEIETNGTIMPIPILFFYVEYWNCSPKLSNSGEPYEKRVKPLVIKELNKRNHVIFKFVIVDSSDVIDLMNDYGEHLTITNVMLMPAGDSRATLNKNRKLVIEQCLLLGFKFSDRLQIVAWNKTTGV